MSARRMFRSGLQAAVSAFTAVLCSAVLALPGSAAPVVLAQASPAAAPAGTLSPDELDSLVAPIALYPDPLLSQALVASTYPLEVVQLQQWLAQHKELKGDALAKAVEQEKWDPSIQALAPLPDIVKQLADHIAWTTDLGNAFLAQETAVMEAVQRMRKKAQGTGGLKSTEQQKVTTETVEGGKQVIVVQPSNPEVVYVPSYNPTVVYGAAPYYPYPPVYYPTGGLLLSFGVGVAMGAFWGGGYGWGCGWGNNSININNNNSFVRNSNTRNGVSNRTGNSTWQHNAQHRGGAPYGNRDVANKFGGSARGDTRGNGAGGRGGVGGVGGAGGARGPGGAGGVGGPGGAGGLGGAGGVGGAGRPGGVGGAGGAGGPGGFGGAGGANSIGGRNVPSGAGAANRGAFNGASSGSASAARASSSRGAASRGGGARGGGGRGGRR